MKKRVWSLLLCLCTLTGLLTGLTPPASAASSALGETTVDMERVNKVNIKGKEDTDFIFDSDPRWGERYYYIGKDKGSDELGIYSTTLTADGKEGFIPGAASMYYLNFTGMWLNYPVNGVGSDIAEIEPSMNNAEPKQFITASQSGKLQIDVKEISGGRNDSNIAYVPFALAVEVPAQTSQTVRYTFDISASRNSKGAAGYYAEILRCPYSPTTITKNGITTVDYDATYLSTFMKQSVHLQMGDTARASDLSITPNGLKPGQRAYWETKTGGFTQITTEVQYVNNTDQPKRMARYFALYMGVGASSGITSPYRHNLQCTINISRSNVESEPLIPRVAQIGETKYETIEEAVAAYNKTDGQTLKLLENVSSGAGQVSLTASGTVDLNGKEWKEKGFLIGSPNGNKTVTIRNGMLQCSAENTSSGSFLYVNGGCTLNLGVGEDKASVRSGGQCRTAVAVGPNGRLGITNTIFGREVDIQLLEGAQIDILGPLGNTKSGSDTFRLALSGTATLANPITIAHGAMKWETTTTNTSPGEGTKYQTPGQMFTLTNMPGCTAVFSADTSDTSTTVVVRPIQLTLDAKGGACGVTQIGTNQALPTPVKPGYTFLHWSEYPSGSSAVDLSKIKEDTTLYAQWKAAELKVTFNLNGGEGTAAASTVEYGGLYTLPDANPTRTGYNFAGWYTQAEGGTRVSETTPCEQTGDHTLYAHWNPKNVKVTLKANGGTVTTSSKTVTYTKTYGDLPIPTRAGYEFDGWYTAETDGTKVESATKVEKGYDHTLYARWKANGVTVTLHNVGENGAGTETKQVTYGDTYGVAIANLPRPGHRLLGWAPTEAEAAAGSVSVFESSRVTNSNDHELWAVWFRFSYPVTFRDGGNTLSTVSVLYGGTVEKPADPTKGDFTFLGWTKTKDGTDYWKFESDTVTDSTTLYAAWEKPQCAVTLDANGGSFDGGAATTEVKVPYGTIINQGSHTAPTRKGYTFVGWSGSKNGPAASQSITAARTLYAIWEGAEVTVAFQGAADGEETTRVCKYGQGYGALPEAAGEGDFRGWYTQPDGGGERVFSYTRVNNDQPHTLYAWFSAVHTHDGRTFEQLNTWTPNYKNGGNFYLPGQCGFITFDYNDTSATDKELYLCLNGNKVESSGYAIEVTAGHTLHLYDCSNGKGLVSATKSSSTPRSIRVKGGTVYLHSGTLTCAEGYGVRVESGEFIMEGGTITGSKAYEGGGVCVDSGGTFTMKGGTITGNTATSSGGGVYVDDGGTFTMEGGTITGNTASGTSKGNGGGGVYVESGGTFNMTGGTISGNTTSGTADYNGGGGVFVAGTFNMNGDISDNTASGDGGGVYVYGGTFNMTGGSISGNTAVNGGGVCVAKSYSSDKGSTVNVESGDISGNTASSNGGGVYFKRYCGTNATFKGTISDNKAVNGGGVYDDEGGHIFGGTITDNEATGDGGGICMSWSTAVNGKETLATLDGVEITGNKVTGADSLGGGMCINVNGGTTIMKGTVTLTGNTREADGAAAWSNYYFYSSTSHTSPRAPITISDMSESSKIAVGFNHQGYYSSARPLSEGFRDLTIAEKFVPCFTSDEPEKYYVGAKAVTDSSESIKCVALKKGTDPNPVDPAPGGSDTHTHAPCGADSCSHDGHGSATYTAYTSDLTGNVYLEADVGTLTVSGDVNLCLNGRNVQTLTVTGGTLTLCDCQGGGTVASVSVTGGKLDLYGGDLTSLNVTGGTVNLNGGSTGSLTVESGATVTLDGGAVNGGITNNGTLTLKSGAVTGDVKQDGGNLTLDGKPVLTGQIVLAKDQTITIGTNAQQPDTPYVVAPAASAPVNVATGWEDSKGTPSGWFTPATGGVEVKADGGTVKFTPPPRTVTVTKPGGGTETIQTEDDGTVTLPENTGPAPTGKLPDGWTTDPGGGETGKIDDTTPFDEDTIIYPCWKDCDHNSGAAWQVTETHDSTCAEEGYTVSTCSLCQETKTETLPATGAHSYGEDWEHDETAHWKECSVCHAKSDLAAHTLGTEPTGGTAPTCDTEGSQTFACTVCGKTATVALPALGHDYSGAWASDATQHWHKCIRCGAEGTDREAHDYTIPGAVTKAAEVGVKGAQEYLCVCGASKTEELPALPEPEPVLGKDVFSVTFDLGQYVEGEAPIMEPQAKGTQIALPGLTVTRTGYTFQGWDYTTTENKEVEMGGQIVTVPEEVTTTYRAGDSFTMPAQSVRFTAHWERESSTTLNPGDTLVLDDGTKIEVKDDGTVTVDKDGDGTPETTVKLPDGQTTVEVTQETKTDNDGKTETTKDTIVLPGGSVVDPNPGEDGPKVTVGGGGGTLDTDGNSKLPEGSTVETTDENGTKTTVTIGDGGDGNVEPDGTVTFPEGGNATVQTGDGDPVDVEIKKPESGEEPGDITVQPCTVTFDMQDHGEPVEAMRNVTPGSKITAPAEPTAEGWVFGGWFWDPDFAEGTKWDFDTHTVDGNLTLYAKWTRKAETPNITGQPTAPEGELTAGQIPTGDEAPKLKVTVEPPTDGGTLTYQWYEKDENDEWQPIENATGPDYTIPTDIQPGDHAYKCEVTNTGDGKEPTKTESNPVTVTVKDAPIPAKPTVTLPEGGNTLTVEKGKTEQINVTVEPKDTKLTWESSDDSVATVDENGNIEAVGPGTATITIKPEGGDPVTITVTVTDPAKPDNTVDLGNGITVTLPEDKTKDDIADNGDGTKKVPEGSIVHIGDDNPAITLPDGGDVNPDTGGVKVPDDKDSKITIRDKEGHETDITVPGGGTVTPDKTKGDVEVPEGSKVQTGGGPEITVPGGTKVDPDGTVTPPTDGKVTISDGTNTTEITVPGGGTVTPDDDGTVTVPEGSEVKKLPDGPAVKVPEGGAKVDPDGTVTPIGSAHVHEWAAGWEHNDTHHWHRCTAANCTITDYSTCGEAGAACGAHSYAGDGKTCQVCGYERAAWGAPDSDAWTIDYENESITIQEGYEVNTGKDGAGDPVSSGSALTPGTTLYIRRPADETHAASVWVEIKIPARPDAPAVKPVNETASGSADGKITGLTPGTAYEISSDGGKTWTEAAVTDDGTIAGLAPGKYQVRSKATGEAFAGNPAGVEIATGDAKTYTLNVKAPTFDAVTVGYERPEAKPITITSAGNSDATIYSVTVDTEYFTIGGGGGTVPAGGSISTWTIQPKAGLEAGTYTATVTVIYDEDNSTAATAEARFSVNTAAPVHTHEWGGWTITAAPTETTPGTAERVCAKDGSHKEIKTLPALTDTAVWTPGARVEPEEGKDGSQTYISEYGEVTVVIPATGHTHEWGGWTITAAPTETKPGTAERVCTKDGSHKEIKTLPALTDTTVWTPGARVEPEEGKDGSQTYISEYGEVTVVIPAAVHTHAWAATWTSDRDCHWHECTAGGCSIAADNQKSGYARHRENQGIVTKTPTAGEAGLRMYQCVDCLRILRTEAIPALGFEISGTVTQDGEPASGATVTLRQGSENIRETIADDQGYYSFPAVSPGTYNVVGTKDGKTVTKLVVLTAENATNLNLQMPSEEVNSIVKVKGDTDGSAADVGKTVVGNLDTEAEAQKEEGATVTVTMTVEKQTASDSDKDQTAIRDKIAEESGEIGAEKKLEFLAVTITKEVKTEQGTSSKDLKETRKIIEIVIPYNFSGKKDVAVYRYHVDDQNRAGAERLVPGNGSEGTFKLDKANGLIRIYAQKFSTYAITYTEAEEETGKEYTLTVNGGQGSGTYRAGETVFISVRVPSGQRFDRWNASVNGIQFSAQQNGYTFTMPERNLTITAQFEDIRNGGDGDDDDESADPTYRPTVEKAQHGGVTVRPSEPKQGDRVTVTVKPDEGYEVAEVIVVDKDGRRVKVTKNADGTYSFTQPSGKVRISAVLQAVQSAGGYAACPRNETCPIWPFTDASSTAWYHDGVHYCIEKGLMNGYGGGIFGPNHAMSRAQLAQILYNQAGRPAVSGSSPFDDVAPGAWYADAIAWAAASGIVSGYGDGRYGPEDPVTREQFAVMLWRNAGNPANTGNLNGFVDGSRVSAWAVDALCWAVEQDVVAGKDNGILDPTGTATRAEAATMLMRYLEKAG